MNRSQLWPFGLTCVLVLFVAAVVAFSVFARRQGVELVVDGYYEAELEYQDQIDRQRRTEELSTAPTVALVESEGRVLITFSELEGMAATGEIHLYRPSAASLDRKIPLSLDTGGRQLLDVVDLEEGLWIVKVIWTQLGEEFFLEQRLVLAKAEP